MGEREEYRKKDENRKVDNRKLKRGTERGVTERDNGENCERRTWETRRECAEGPVGEGGEETKKRDEGRS